MDVAGLVLKILAAVAIAVMLWGIYSVYKHAHKDDSDKSSKYTPIDVHGHPGRLLDNEYTSTMMQDTGVDMDLPPLIEDKNKPQDYSDDRSRSNIRHQLQTALSAVRDRSIDNPVYVPNLICDDITDVAMLAPPMSARLGSAKTSRKTSKKSMDAVESTEMQGIMLDHVYGQTGMSDGAYTSDKIGYVDSGEGTAYGVSVGVNPSSSRGAEVMYGIGMDHGDSDKLMTEINTFEHDKIAEFGELQDSTRSPYHTRNARVYDDGVADLVGAEYERDGIPVSYKTEEVGGGGTADALQPHAPSTFARKSPPRAIPFGTLKMTKTLKPTPHSANSPGDLAPVTYISEQINYNPGQGYGVTHSRYDDNAGFLLE